MEQVSKPVLIFFSRYVLDSPEKISIELKNLEKSDVNRSSIMALKTFLIILAVATATLAKPASDIITFRDEDDVDDTALTLEDENQVFIPAKTRLDGEENEVVAQRLEHGKFFQGDIKLVQDQKEYLLANNSDGSVPTRTGWIDEYYRWPKDERGNVVMPYVIASDSGYCESKTGFGESFVV